MGDILDDLISEGLKSLPSASADHRAVSPRLVESESTLVRHAAWYEVTTCDCGALDVHFDGLFEERNFNRPDAVTPRHWLRCGMLPPVLIDPVAYTRKYTSRYCEKCSGANMLTIKELG